MSTRVWPACCGAGLPPVMGGPRTDPLHPSHCWLSPLFLLPSLGRETGAWQEEGHQSVRESQARPASRPQVSFVTFPRRPLEENTHRPAGR